MACVIHRKIRESNINQDEASAIGRQFREDVEDGVWSLLPVTERLLGNVSSFIASLNASIFLRAGDAVHLVTAQREGFTEIWTNDRHLGLAAQHAGLAAREV